MKDTREDKKTVQGVQGNLQNVIKGGYYVAPSSPAEPLVQTSATWGTASPSLASTSIQQPQSSQPSSPIQQPVQQQSAPKQNTR